MVSLSFRLTLSPFDYTICERKLGRWRNGSRDGLKIRWGDPPCGFDSHPPHFGRTFQVHDTWKVFLLDQVEHLLRGRCNSSKSVESWQSETLQRRT